MLETVHFHLLPDFPQFDTEKASFINTNTVIRKYEQALMYL